MYNMCKTKKILVMLTALVLVLGLMIGVAGAAQTDQEWAVNKLIALDLVKGDPDGNLRLNDDVTRAEAAALMVRLRGLEDMAERSQGATIFPDVAADHWASGYVNVAVSQGIIVGHADGTFKPNDTVTYAENATMLVRLMGYEPAVSDQPWPQGHLARAAQIGLNKGISTGIYQNAPRGVVFQMISNALDEYLMEQVAFGSETRWEVMDGQGLKARKTIYSEYLDIEAFDERWQTDFRSEPVFVLAVPASDLTLKENEVRLGRGPVEDGDYYGPKDGIYKVDSNVNISKYIGEPIQVWIKDRGKDDYVVAVLADEDYTVINSFEDGIHYDRKKVSSSYKPDILGDGGKGLIQYEIVTGDKYDVHDDVYVSVNVGKDKYGKGLGYAYFHYLVNGGHKRDAQVKLVLDDNDDVIVMIVYENAKPEEIGAYGAIVEDVDSGKERISVVTQTGGREDIRLDDKTYRVLINGQMATLADLEEYDVVYVYKDVNGKKDHELVVAVRASVAGEVTGMRSIYQDSIRFRLEFDGDFEKQVARTAGYSYGDIYDVDNAIPSDIEDLEGANVVGYLDARGEIRFVLSDSEGTISNKIKGVVVKSALYDRYRDEANVDVLNEYGQIVTLTIVDEDDVERYEMDANGRVITREARNYGEVEQWLYVNSAAINGMRDVVFVEYETKPNMDVRTLRVLSGQDNKGNDIVFRSKAADPNREWFEITKNWRSYADDDDDLIVLGGSSYTVTSRTKVFDLTGKDKIKGSLDQLNLPRIEIDDAAKSSWTAIKKKNVEGGSLQVYVVTYRDEVDFIFAVGPVGQVNVASKGTWAIGNGYTRIGGDDAITLLNLETGENENIVASSRDVVGRRDIVYYELDRDGEIDKTRDLVKFGAMEVVINKKDLVNADLDVLELVYVNEVRRNAIVAEGGIHFAINNSTKFYDGYNRVPISGVSKGDYVVVIDNDDDGSVIDFVIWLTDDDEVRKGIRTKPTVTRGVDQYGDGAKTLPALLEALENDIDGAEDEYAGKKSDYTPETWNNYETALAAAKVVLAKGNNATAVEVEDAKDALNTAINGLVTADPNIPAVDISADSEFNSSVAGYFRGTLEGTLDGVAINDFTGYEVVLFSGGAELARGNANANGSFEITGFDIDTITKIIGYDYEVLGSDGARVGFGDL